MAVVGSVDFIRRYEIKPLDADFDHGDRVLWQLAHRSHTPAASDHVGT